MTRPRLSLAIIAKNEEENLRNCLASVRQFVDELVVVDTGSTDGTRAVAVQFGASVIDFSPITHPDAFFLDDAETCRRFGYDVPGTYSNVIQFADFAAARNVSFEHCTGDYILWVDSDDVVEGAENLPKIVGDLAKRNLPMGFLAYDYARDHLGRVFYRQWRERIIRRGLGNWVNDVHEVFMPSTQVPAIVRYDDVKMSHRRKADRPGMPNRNYKLLLRMLSRGQMRAPGSQPDPRTLFYLGQESRFIEPRRAVGFYDMYLRSSGWDEERSAAHMALGQLFEGNVVGLDDITEAWNRANKEYGTAWAEKPDNPDGLFGMARVAHHRGRWSDCARFTERALAIGNTDSMLGANPMDRLYRPYFFYNVALNQLGRVAEAAAACEKGLAACPDDPGIPGAPSGMLTLNLKVYRAHLAQQAPTAPEGKPVVEFDKNEDVDAPPAQGIPRDALVIWAMQLWKQLIAAGEFNKATIFLSAVPQTVREDAAFERMRASTERQRARAEASPARKDAIVEVTRSALQELIDGPRPPRADGSDVQPIAKWVPCGAVPANARELGEAYRAAAQFGGMRDASATGPRVVFFVGPAFQPWDPTTPEKTGIGGSETAVIEMARELARLGCDVTVYGDCAASAGIYDGVRYHHHDKFLSPFDCDVLISSRRPDIADANVRAKLKLLWVHDVNVGPPTADMERWLLWFDRVLCLSEWHKGFFLSCYPTLHPDRVLVTRNGIDPARFDARQSGDLRLAMGEQVRKTGNRLVYSSSPNRGLDLLLALMPEIRKHVPDAHLDIFYGFEAWETFARMRGDRAELDAIEGFKRMISDAERAGYATFHGRVPQSKLARAFMEAKVWAYPTSFLETSCITAMEAQAAGCIPVTSKIAALPETVKHGFLVEPGQRYGEQWLAAVIGMLRDDGAREKLARAARTYALAELSWSGLAKGWLEMFELLTRDAARNPVAPWKEAV